MRSRRPAAFAAHRPTAGSTSPGSSSAREQILVGAPAPASAFPPAAATASTAGTLVNLNTADEAALEGLPEVGPVTAQSILDWRTKNGAFTSVQELLEVDGIGE